MAGKPGCPIRRPRTGRGCTTFWKRRPTALVEENSYRRRRPGYTERVSPSPRRGSGMVKGIDLFASAGGLTLGLKAAGVDTVCAVEVDPYRTQTFALHTPDAEIISRDVKDFGFTR